MVEYIGDFDEYRGVYNYCPVCGRMLNYMEVPYEQMEKRAKKS